MDLGAPECWKCTTRFWENPRTEIPNYAPAKLYIYIALQILYFIVNLDQYCPNYILLFGLVSRCPLIRWFAFECIIWLKILKKATKFNFFPLKITFCNYFSVQVHVKKSGNSFDLDHTSVYDYENGKIHRKDQWWI